METDVGGAIEERVTPEMMTADAVVPAEVVNLAVGCRRASWNPEAITFYGDGPTVFEKLGHAEMGLRDRRVYLFLLEATTSAELMLFEQADASSYHVYRWEGSNDPGLPAQISAMLLANQGIACVGEQTKSIVLDLPGIQHVGTIPAPTTARAAFGHPVRARGGEYMRVTAFLLC